MILEHKQVSRIHLCRAFGIKEATATRVFRAYRNAHSDNLVFEPSSKAYMASKEFIAHNLTVDPKIFLSAAQIMAEDQIIQFTLS
jgi:hypothetical protein